MWSSLIIDVFSHYGKTEFEQFLVDSKWKKKEVFSFLNNQLRELHTPEDFNVIFDSISFFMKLDVDFALKEWLLNKLYLLSKESKNLFYIYLMKGVAPEIINMVIEISDVVFNIRSEEVGAQIKSTDRYFQRYCLTICRKRLLEIHFVFLLY